MDFAYNETGLTLVYNEPNYRPRFEVHVELVIMNLEYNELFPFEKVCHERVDQWIYDFVQNCFS